jgi:hypothetical protein
MNIKYAISLFCIISRFKDRYEKKILRGNEKNASDREKYVGSTVAKVSIILAMFSLLAALLT